MIEIGKSRDVFWIIRHYCGFRPYCIPGSSVALIIQIISQLNKLPGASVRSRAAHNSLIYRAITLGPASLFNARAREIYDVAINLGRAHDASNDSGEEKAAASCEKKAQPAARRAFQARVQFYKARAWKFHSLFPQNKHERARAASRLTALQGKTAAKDYVGHAKPALHGELELRMRRTGGLGSRALLALVAPPQCRLRQLAPEIQFYRAVGLLRLLEFSPYRYNARTIYIYIYMRLQAGRRVVPDPACV